MNQILKRKKMKMKDIEKIVGGNPVLKPEAMNKLYSMDLAR